MKKSILICSISLFSIHLKATEPIRITVTISDSLSITKEDQWVYWFSLIGNEYNIEDSCFLTKGQKIFRMEKTFSDRGENVDSWLTFSKEGPMQGIFYPAPGEDIRININPRDFLFLTDVEGSPGTSETYKNVIEWGEVSKKIRILNDSLSKETDSITIHEILDSVNFYKKYYEKEFWLDVFSR